MERAAVSRKTVAMTIVAVKFSLRERGWSQDGKA